MKPGGPALWGEAFRAAINAHINTGYTTLIGVFHTEYGLLNRGTCSIVATEFIMSREAAAAAASRGPNKTGLHFVKLRNPFITSGDKEGDTDERPSKCRVMGIYKVLQGWSLGSREELTQGGVISSSHLLRMRALHRYSSISDADFGMGTSPHPGSRLASLLKMLVWITEVL